MNIFYKRVNQRHQKCENCGKEGVKIALVRWVDDKGSYVASHNIDPEFYCSIECAREHEGGGNFIRVRRNTIEEINALGYRA